VDDGVEKKGSVGNEYRFQEDYVFLRFKSERREYKFRVELHKSTDGCKVLLMYHPDMTEPPVATSLALYKLTPSELWWCTGPTDPPKDFTTRRGDGKRLTVLRRCAIKDRDPGNRENLGEWDGAGSTLEEGPRNVNRGCSTGQVKAPGSDSRFGIK
jgi:hypothetical protein